MDTNVPLHTWLAIMLSRVKMSFSDLRLNILRVSEDQLSEQLLRQLLQYIPTSEEQVLLTENLENLEQLGKAEQFYMEVSPMVVREFLIDPAPPSPLQMMKMDRYEQRLRAILYKRKFHERCEELLAVGHLSYRVETSS